MHGLRGWRQQGARQLALLQQQLQQQALASSSSRASTTATGAAPRRAAAPRAPSTGRPASRGAGAGAGRRRPLPPSAAAFNKSAPTDPAVTRLLEGAEQAALEGRTKAAMVLLEEAITDRGLRPALAYHNVLRVLEAAAARPLAVAALGGEGAGPGASRSISSNSNNSTGIAAFFEGPGAWYDAPNFFRLAVLACNRAGSPREAARLLRRMRAKRLPVPAQAYSNVVHAAAEAGDDALCLEVLGELRRRARAQREKGEGGAAKVSSSSSGSSSKEERLVLSIRDYLGGLRACGRLGDAGTAQGLLEEAGALMAAGEMPPHGSLYAAGIQALVACGQPGRAVAYLGAMDRRVRGGALMLPFDQLKALALACAAAGDEAAARVALRYVKQPALLEALRPELRAVAPTLAAAAAGENGGGMPSVAPSARVEEEGEEMDEEGGSDGDERRAAAMEDGQQQPQQRQPPKQHQAAAVGLGEDAGPEEYRQALVVLVRKGRPDLAQRVLRLMRARGLPLETAGVDAVLQAHLKDGAFVAAWALFQEMAGPAGGGWRPQASTYQLLLRACDRGARGREAMALVKRAEADGVRLAARMLGHAACAAAKARETINARGLIARMDALGAPVPLRCWLELAESEALAGNGPSVLYELASRGVPPTLRLHVACGLPARALQLFDAQGPAAAQPGPDVAMAMAAAAQLRDPGRVAALLAAAEAAPALGAELARDPSVVTNACRALGGRADPKEERACADAILRYMARHGLARVDVGLVVALRDQGRLAEARGLVARWAARRLSLYADEEGAGSEGGGVRAVLATGQHTSGPAYSAAMNALGALGAWPVAHYLYDEALLRFRGQAAGAPAFLRALVHALTEGQGDLEDGDEEAALRRAMARRAYRQAAGEGWVSHWGGEAARKNKGRGGGGGVGGGDSPLTMDVHRFPFRLAAVAVEAVLEDLLAAAASPSERQPQRQRPQQAPLPRYLWVVTGVGKHVNAPGQAAGQRTLRDRLAGYLAERHGLLSAEELAYLRGRQDAAAGRIRVTGAALRAWVDRQQQQQGP